MFFLLAIGCAKATPVTPTTLPEGPAPTARAAAPEIPAEVAKLRGLLQAHHAEDLPNKEAMDINGAPDALHWLATNDELMIIRERSLQSLRFYSDDASQKICLDVFESKAHAKLRAAAIRCLVTRDLMADSTTRNKLLGALRDTDARVGLAAVAVLAEIPAARSGLKAAREDGAIPELTMAALKELPL